MKGLTDQENMSIIYASNNGPPIYPKQRQTEMRGDIDNSTVIVGGLKFHLQY